MAQTKYILTYIILPLIVGTLIYVLFRSNTLLVFEWLEYIGMSNIVNVMRGYTVPLCKYIPNILLYSLPDGIWVYSGTASLLLVWQHNLYKYLWMCLPIACAVGAEILQGIGLIAGTFCMFDITTYIIGFILSYIIDIRREKNDKIHIN